MFTAISPAAPSPCTARAAIISFRTSNEYVEIHCPVIERPDGTVYIMSGGQRTGAIGKWEQSGSKVDVKLTKVVGVACGRVKFTVTANSVSDDSGSYTPVTRLVAPEFETLINAAKQTGAKCGDA